MSEKSFTKILNRRGWLYRRLRRSEDICFTRRQKEKLFFESEVKDTLIEWLEANKETRTAPNPISGIVTIYQTTAAELLERLDENNLTKKEER